MKRILTIVAAAMLVGGCALVEGYGEMDVCAFPVFVRCSEDERKTDFLGPGGLLAIWDSTTNGVEAVLIPPLLTYVEPGNEFCSPLFSWRDDGTLKILMTGRGVCNDVTNICITPLMGMTSGAEDGEWLFPVWSRSGDASYDKRLALLDADRLPDGADDWWHAERKRKFLLLLGDENSVYYSYCRGHHDGASTHRITHVQRWCYIPFAGKRKYWTDYDNATRKRLASGTCDSLDFLIGSYERKKGGVGGVDCFRWSIPGESLIGIFSYKTDEEKGAEFSILSIPIWHEDGGTKASCP